MDIIKKTIGNHEYTFYCKYVNCRDGFSHTCELYMNGWRINSSRRHYINRTWESYRYQSVMLDAVRNELDYIVNKGIDEYKESNGIQRLIKARREKVLDAIHNSAEYAEMKLLYDMVNNARYGTEEERERLESLDKMLKLTEALASIGFFGHKAEKSA